MADVAVFLTCATLNILFTLHYDDCLLMLHVVAMNTLLTFSIPNGVAGNNFQINSTTGAVTTTSSLDRELRSNWIVTGQYDLVINDNNSTPTI